MIRLRVMLKLTSSSLVAFFNAPINSNKYNRQGNQAYVKCRCFPAFFARCDGRDIWEKA